MHFHFGLLHRSLNLDLLQREVTGDLVAHYEGDLIKEFTEIFGRGVLVPHDRKLVLDHRVVDYMQLAHSGKVLYFVKVRLFSEYIELS